MSKSTNVLERSISTYSVDLQCPRYDGKGTRTAYLTDATINTLVAAGNNLTDGAHALMNVGGAVGDAFEGDLKKDAGTRFVNGIVFASLDTGAAVIRSFECLVLAVALGVDGTKSLARAALNGAGSTEIRKRP